MNKISLEAPYDKTAIVPPQYIHYFLGLQLAFTMIILLLNFGITPAYTT